MIFLLPNNKPFTGYKDGSEKWKDDVLSYGIGEATVICRNYLDMNLKREHSAEEGQFCRELFTAMYNATAGRIDPKKLIYPYSLEAAEKRSEKSYYILGYKFNTDCARGIDALINDSCYKTSFYNLEIAAMRAIQEYGFQRICLVLAFNFQNKGSDGRISATHWQWADTFVMQKIAFSGAWLQAHAILIDSFCNYIRKLYHYFDAGRFALPGIEERGEFVGGVEIKRAITTSSDGKGFSTGYAIGHDPNAVNPWVCWQFASRNGTRDYNWGVYGNDEQTAIDAYNARVFAALN